MSNGMGTLSLWIHLATVADYEKSLKARVVSLALSKLQIDRRCEPNGRNWSFFLSTFSPFSQGYLLIMKKSVIIGDKATPAHICLCKVCGPKGYEMYERKRNVDLGSRVFLQYSMPRYFKETRSTSRSRNYFKEKPMLRPFLRGRHPWPHIVTIIT